MLRQHQSSEEGAHRRIRYGDGHLTVQSAGAAKSRVDSIGPVRRADHDQAPICIVRHAACAELSRIVAASERQITTAALCGWFETVRS